MVLKQLSLLSVCFVFASAPVWAKKTEQVQLVDAIQQVKEIHCHFSQQTLDKKGGVLQSFQGELAYQRPDHFYWQAGEPMAQKIVSDGKTIWHLDEDLEQLVVQSYDEQADQALLLSVLQKPQSLFDTYEIKSIEKKNQTRHFSLEPKKKPAALNALALTFNNDSLAAFKFEDSLGQNTEINLSGCSDFSAMPEFTIAPPADFDIIYE